MAAPEAPAVEVAPGASPAPEPAAAQEPATAAQPPAAPPLDLDRIAGLWPSVIDQMRQSGAGLLAAAFDAARPVAVDAADALVEVGFPSSAAFNKRKAEAKENRDQLVDAIKTVLGAPLRPVFVTLDDGAAEADSEQAPAGEDPEREDELYRRFVSEFDAEVLTEDAEADAPTDERKEGTS